MKYRINLRAVVLLIVFLVLLIVAFLIGKNIIDNSRLAKGLRNVYITNITESSATIVWTSSEPTVSEILLKKDNSWIPLVEQLASQKFYDERDLDESSPRVYSLKSEEKRTTHFVTLRDLTPESVYYFRINSGIGSMDHGTINQFKTFASLDDLNTPDSAYGNLINESNGDITEGIVTIELEEKTGLKSQMLSGIAYASRGWSVDLGNLRLEDGAKRIPRSDGELLRVVAFNETGIGSVVVDDRQYQPVVGIVIGTESSASQSSQASGLNSNGMNYISSSIESEPSSSLINTALASEGNGTVLAATTCSGFNPTTMQGVTWTCPKSNDASKKYCSSTLNTCVQCRNGNDCPTTNSTYSKCIQGTCGNSLIKGNKYYFVNGSNGLGVFPEARFAVSISDTLSGLTASGLGSIWKLDSDGGFSSLVGKIECTSGTCSGGKICKTVSSASERSATCSACDSGPQCGAGKECKNGTCQVISTENAPAGCTLTSQCSSGLVCDGTNCVTAPQVASVTHACQTATELTDCGADKECKINATGNTCVLKTDTYEKDSFGYKKNCSATVLKEWCGPCVEVGTGIECNPKACAGNSLQFFLDKTGSNRGNDCNSDNLLKDNQANKNNCKTMESYVINSILPSSSWGYFWDSDKNLCKKNSGTQTNPVVSGLSVTEDADQDGLKDSCSGALWKNYCGPCVLQTDRGFVECEPSQCSGGIESLISGDRASSCNSKTLLNASYASYCKQMSSYVGKTEIGGKTLYNNYSNAADEASPAFFKYRWNGDKCVDVTAVPPVADVNAVRVNWCGPCIDKSTGQEIDPNKCEGGWDYLVNQKYRGYDCNSDKILNFPQYCKSMQSQADFPGNTDKDRWCYSYNILTSTCSKKTNCNNNTPPVTLNENPLSCHNLATEYTKVLLPGSNRYDYRRACGASGFSSPLTSSGCSLDINGTCTGTVGNCSLLLTHPQVMFSVSQGKCYPKTTGTTIASASYGKEFTTCSAIEDDICQMSSTFGLPCVASLDSDGNKKCFDKGACELIPSSEKTKCTGTCQWNATANICEKKIDGNASLPVAGGQSSPGNQGQSNVEGISQTEKPINIARVQTIWKQAYSEICGANGEKCPNNAFSPLGLNYQNVGCSAAGIVQCNDGYLMNKFEMDIYYLLLHEATHLLTINTNLAYNQNNITGQTYCFIAQSGYGSDKCGSRYRELVGEIASTNAGGYRFETSNGEKLCGSQVLDYVSSKFGGNKEDIRSFFSPETQCSTITSLSAKYSYDFCSDIVAFDNLYSINYRDGNGNPGICNPNTLAQPISPSESKLKELSENSNKHVATRSVGAQGSAVLGVTTGNQDSFQDNPNLTETGSYYSYNILDSGLYTVASSQSIQNTYYINENSALVFFYDTNSNGKLDPTEQLVSKNEATSLSINVEKEAESLSYLIKSGWNLISIPMVFEGDNTTKISRVADLVDFMNSKGGKVTNVSVYRDGRFVMYTRRTDTNGNPVSFGDNFTIVPGEGIFVKSNNQVEFNLFGKKVTGSLEIELSSGWNLIGLFKGGQASVGSFDVLKQMQSKSITADTISKWDGGKYLNNVRESDNEYGYEFRVFPTQGYFVRVGKAGGGKFKLD